MKAKLQEILKIISNEPNKETFEYKGYKCLIKRHHLFGSLNGYVGLPQGHKLYEKSYDDIYKIQDIDCHGGLTFAGFWDDVNDRLWYIGFDCAHYNDITPLSEMTLPLDMQMKIWEIDPTVTYKDINYVRQECKKIVDQLTA